jgi:hypothetical protein
MNYSVEEFLNCSKKIILETLPPKISCITYNIKEFVDPNIVMLPECHTKETARSTFKTYCLFIDDYISRTSEFGCPVPCKQKSFKYKLEYFSRNSWIELDDDNRLGNDTFELNVGFDSLNIEERTETFVYDVGNFLAAAGGNLGLFMGFSCLSILFALIDCLKTLFQNSFDHK